MKLERIKEKIESMPQFHQIEVLRILEKDKVVVLNENKNGVFVNLTHAPSNVIDELIRYIGYVDQQQTRLQKQEHARVSLEKQFFNSTSNSNKEKDNVKISCAHGTE
jgi:hypothetical protein